MTDRAEVEHRSSSRRELLALLRGSDRPLDVSELAALTGLHPNTLRGHLQLLVDLGEVEREVEPRDTPGRPRVLYSIRPTDGTDDPYRQLAGELAAGIAHQSGNEGAAHAAGRHWGRRVRARARLDSDAPLGAERATALAADGLRDLGFATETEPLGDRLYLTFCPFEQLARENRSVCQVHLDLLNGLFDELGGGVTCGSLDAFVRPDLCVAHLERDPEAGPGPEPATDTSTVPKTSTHRAKEPR